MDREMGEWAVSIRGRDLLINTRVNTEKGEEPSAQTTERRDIKSCSTGSKLIGLPFQHPEGGPYPNGNVASVRMEIFQTIRTDTVTWNVHNDTEEAEGYEEEKVMGSDGQLPWSR